MSTCLQDVVQLWEAQYRLLNTTLRGQAYTVVTEDPLVVTPPILPVVDLTILDQDSILGRIDRLTQLLDNRIAGTATTLYTDLPGVKQQLQSIIDAMSTDDTDLTTIISDLEGIAVLLA